jgi:hypothetical protein
MAAINPLSKDNAHLIGWRNTKIWVALVLGGNGESWRFFAFTKWYKEMYHFLFRFCVKWLHSFPRHRKSCF